MMTSNKGHKNSFNRRLSLTFAGSAIILLLAGAFALYLMSQLGTAVERATGEILPKTLVAMRLSERSALLAASAPSLASARDAMETEQVAADLDKLKVEVDDKLAVLEETSDSDRLEQVRLHVAILADTISNLKSAINARILLDQDHSSAVDRIHEVHSEFSDTVSPVVWGVSSLTRLSGKRTSRANVAKLKALRDLHVDTLVTLLRLRLSYRELIEQEMLGVPMSGSGSWEAFERDWERTLELLTKTRDRDPQQLIEIGKRFHASWRDRQTLLSIRRDREFEAALAQMLVDTQDALARHFSSALQTTESTITELVEQSVKDMGYALDIKAEGNLSFALLTAVADADSSDSVSSLQDRFKRSRAAFLVSSSDFLDSRLSKRNPILAQNVANIERRLLELGEGSDNLFDIRRAQLANHAEIERLLASNRSIAAQLKQDVERLVEAVQQQATGLNKQLERNRGANRIMLVLVFLIGLVLLLIMAYFSIKTLGKQDHEIRQAATVFESAGEGVIITDAVGRIVTVNQAFSDLTGYTKEEITGRRIRILRSKRHHKAFYREMLGTLAKTGRWEGEIYTRNKSGDSNLEWLTVNVVRDSHDEPRQYVAVFSDVTIVKRSLQKLDHLAHHDALTGLPNRLLLRDRLEHAIHRAHRENRQLAILFLDLDRFKNINDTLGHSIGDQLLQVCADRLSQRVREGDTVARLGGDEFMILLEDYQAPDDARIVAQDLLDALSRPFLVQDHELFVTASIGISLYPGDGATVDKLVRNSDAAMYQAKEKGKNNYQFYTSDLTVAAREKLRLESSLRLALEQDQFEMFYQPKWNTKSGDITGVEALLRWHHPERGLIGPDDFLPTLEDCGLILPVGKWILQTACAQAQSWMQQGLPAIQMSVNLSGQQIVKCSLLDMVTDSLKETGFDPRYLELELTEGFIMRQPDEIIESLKSLREMGVSIAIDDFGTGHSSLSYLKQLPIQKLKIDRSFVRDIPADPDDMAITSAIIALGRRLQMSVVAEGVETEEQLAYLIDQGCQEAQGYLFSEALPEHAVRPLLRRGEYVPRQTASSAHA